MVIYLFQILYLFQVFPPETPYPSPSPCFYEGAPTPTHSHLTTCSSIPLHWGIKPSEDQGSLLPLMPDKAILCYICSWSHGSLQRYSLVGSLVPGSSGGIWLVDIVVLPMELQTPSAPSVLSPAPPLGSLCSVQWLATSICLCICQALAEPFRR